MNKKMQKRQDAYKQKILEQLRKTPVVQVACERVGIARATYYRWRKADKQFAKDSDQALLDGSLLINDMAESQLMSAIKDKHMTAIIFWLKHHHPTYATKVEVTTKQSNRDYQLNEEQSKLLTQAISLAALSPGEKKNEK